MLAYFALREGYDIYFGKIEVLNIQKFHQGIFHDKDITLQDSRLTG